MTQQRWAAATLTLLVLMGEAKADTHKLTGDPQLCLPIAPTGVDISRDVSHDHDAGAGKRTPPKQLNHDRAHGPQIPEPLVFDLVRGLGARRGELEVNTLALIDTRRSTVLWAPEVEWAFANGHAVEIELPLSNRHLEAVKLAVQGTLPSPWATFTHGWQAFAELGLDAGHTEAVLVYIWGQRVARRWSYLAMAGARSQLTDNGLAHASPIANAAVFADASTWQTWGIEANATEVMGERLVRLFPQVHVQLGKRVRLQLSAGAELRASQVTPLLAFRAIVE